MSEVASLRSGDGGASETSSQAADRDLLKRRNRGRNVSGEEDDLLEQKKSLQEAVFSAMYMLSRGRSADNWKFAAVKVLLEGLIPFLVLFNPTNGWGIHTPNPVWQVVRWVLPRSPIARIWGYSVYVRVFYAFVAIVYVAVACITFLTLAMRKQEHSKSLRRFAVLLQTLTEVVFSLFYMSMFDYMLFLFNCNYAGHGTHTHTYWTDVQCFKTPHLIHMAVAGVTAVVFFCSTALMLVAGCDLNPVARGIMSSPAAVTRIKVLLMKAMYVIVVNMLSSASKVQAVLMTVAAGLITWYNLSRLPFLRYHINLVWVGGWTAVAYTCTVYCVFEFDTHKGDSGVPHKMVMMVLFGVFPAAAAGAAATALWFRYRTRHSGRFTLLDPAQKLKKVHTFGSPEEVELLSRAMRHFDSDGIILEEKATLGETVIKCGMAVYPGDVGLLILYANFLMEVRRDGPAARTQLQLALKGGPSLVQRYQIFCTIENSKRLKDGQEGALDLQSYVEFKRNYRAVIRMHKAALTAQREFWSLMQRSSVRVSAVEGCMASMDAAADTAHQVYKRVLERYPSNGKLLRCYGKFLEDCRHDPVAAARAYTEAARNGGGDGLLSLDLQITGSDRPEFLTSMDLHEDACVVINAEGTILMVNSCVTDVLGYAKTELEGANVSMIMPQPFSGRHAGYLQRYVQGGEPHILDTVRDVVALHKERYVFPLQLCVTKLSGVGTDAIFLGLLRPVPLDSRNVRAWVTPGGTILCTDPQFASLTGMLSEQMVGCTFQSLCADVAGVEALLEKCKAAPYDVLASGTIMRELFIVHKHLPPVPVEVRVTPGGTDGQRIFVLNAHRTDGATDGLMVVDTKGGLAFATWDVAAMLGHPLNKFLKMKLDQLLPQPFATMHAKYLKDHPVVVPPTSCRAGRLVALVNSNGASVPVRLAVSTQEDANTGAAKHIVQVRKIDASAASARDDMRLVLLCTLGGTILSVDQPDSTLFNFTSGAVVGSNLADCIDVFAEWREKTGLGQLELLLLSLLDREAEVPGTSWRVKVHAPHSEGGQLPNIDPRAPPRAAAGRSACMQSELVERHHPRGAEGEEQGDGGGWDGGAAGDAATSLARVILWRRDLLTGVVELDERLVIRKADVATGLIVGLPPSALMRMPLSRLLDVPRGAKWDELMADTRKKKGALKNSAGLTVSCQRAFEGPHPDGGSMRVFVQGVGGHGSNRVYATLHPDTSFVGARADIYRALGLEKLMNHGSHHHHDHHHDHHLPARHHAATGDQRHGLQPDAERHHGEAQGQGAAAAGAAAAAPAAKPAPSAGDARLAESAALERHSSDGGGGAGGDGKHGQELLANEGHNEGHANLQGEGLHGGDDASLPERDRASVSGGGSQDREGGEGEGEGESDDDGGDDDDDDSGRGPEGSVEEAAHLAARQHRRAHSQSEFVAQWVRTLTLSRHPSGMSDPAAERDAIPPSRGLSRHASLAAAGPEAEAEGKGAAEREAVHGQGQGAAGGSEDGGPPGSGANGGGGVGALPRAGSMKARISRRRLDLGLPPVAEEEAEEAREEEGEEPGRSFGRAPFSGFGSFTERGGGNSLARGGGGGAYDDDFDALMRAEQRPASAALVNPQPAAAGGDEVASSAGDDDDATSQGLGHSLTDASSAVGVDLATDARRARLLKRLGKFFSGPWLSLPLLRMRNQTLVLLAILLVTHVTVYVVFTNLLTRQFTNVRQVHRLALAADRVQLSVVKATIARFCSRPGVSPVSVCEVPLAATVGGLRAALDDLEAYHQATYLGQGAVPRRLQEPTAFAMWTDGGAGTYQLYLDTSPPRWLNASEGVWQLGNRVIAAGRELLYWAVSTGGDIGSLRPYRFLLVNGRDAAFAGYTASLDYLVKYAWDEVEKVQTALIVMLVVESCVVVLGCLAWLWHLVAGVEAARRGAVLAALGLPGPMLRLLADKPVVIVEDSDDEDGDEDDVGAEGGGDRDRDRDRDRQREAAAAAASKGGGGGSGLLDQGSGFSDAEDGAHSGAGGGGAVKGLGGGEGPGSGGGAHADGGGGGGGSSGVVIAGRRGAAAGLHAGRGGRLMINGKELVPSHKAGLLFMVPLLLWQAALVVMFTVSYQKLQGMQGPLASLNMASHVIYRYTRVRMSALLLVSSAGDSAAMDGNRQLLRAETANLESEYDTLMYGGLAVTQAGSAFTHSVPASTFESASFASNFFKEERCFRWDQSLCYTRDSPYYEVTHHGLDVMMRRILSEMRLLVSDDDADVAYNGTRYTTMYMVGTKDLYEGLQSSAQLFVDYSIDRYSSIKLLHTVLLAVTVVVLVAYGLLLVRPYGGRVERQAAALAGLLSHVPAEMDVSGHVRRVVRQAARGRGRGRREGTEAARVGRGRAVARIWQEVPAERWRARGVAARNAARRGSPPVAEAR